MQVSEKQVYKLGRVVFSIKNCDPEFARQLDLLLPHCHVFDRNQVIEIDTGCIKELRPLFNDILKRHYKCLWIDAGCLVSKRQKKLLLAGPSGSGKSTTTMALALGFDWQVLTEDIVLIDLESLSTINLATPFSVKPGCLKILMETINRAPEPIIQEEWFAINDLALNEECDGQFDAAIILGGWAPRLNLKPMDAAEFLRRILPHSNILKIEGSLDKVMMLLSAAQCFELRGGTLRERLDAILDIFQE